MGVGDGTFRPNQAITYGEAVTILMRVLGYGSADVATGSNWYDGYVAVAQSSGLADGLSLGGAATLPRHCRRRHHRLGAHHLRHL